MRSTTLTAEAQIRDYLGTFQLPDELVDQVIRLYDRAIDQYDLGEDRRREIGRRLERIRELYKWGDLTREAYAAERDQLAAELSTIGGTTDRAAVLAQAATFLRDLPAA